MVEEESSEEDSEDDEVQPAVDDYGPAPSNKNSQDLTEKVDKLTDIVASLAQKSLPAGTPPLNLNPNPPQGQHASNSYPPEHPHLTPTHPNSFSAYPVSPSSYPIPLSYYPVPPSSYSVPPSFYPVPSGSYSIPSCSYSVPRTSNAYPTEAGQAYRAANLTPLTCEYQTPPHILSNMAINSSYGSFPGLQISEELRGEIFIDQYVELFNILYPNTEAYSWSMGNGKLPGLSPSSKSRRYLNSAE